MKFTKIEAKEYTAKYVDVSVPVRYDDEDMRYDAPLRDGDIWKARIDLETKSIVNWPKGKTLDFYMKIVDCGTYRLLDADENELASIEQDYVPNSLLPGDYGDYLSLNIDNNGIIINWMDHADLSNFEKEEW